MIRIENISIINIGRIKLPQSIANTRQSKLSKIIIKCFKQSCLHRELLESIDNFSGDKYLLEHLVSYAYNPLYETQINNKTKYVLPFITPYNSEWYNIYGTNELNNSIVWKYEDKIISILDSPDLKFSHIVLNNNIEYACLSIRRLPDIQDIKKTYTTVYHLMKEFNHQMSEKTCLEILSDWFEKEISDFLFRICQMTKETIESNLDYIQKDVKTKTNLKLIDLTDVCNPDVYNSNKYLI